MSAPVFPCLVLATLASLLATTPAPSARSPLQERSTPAFGAAEKRSEIDAVLRTLNELYVYPEVAALMEQEIREREARGEYERVMGPSELAALLTAHLQEASKDRHLNVRARPPRPSGATEASAPRSHGDAEGDGPSPEEIARLRQEMGWNNFGVESVQRLAGNVGYLDLRAFAPIELARDTLAGAMAVLANSRALILDLRGNGGGQPEAVQFLCSYLFPSEPRRHLNSIYSRPEDRTEEFWTLPELPGERFLDRPVFVLVSPQTFSAAEECAYNLQAHGRALIVGQTSGGGANPGGLLPVTDKLEMFVPTGCAINPITNTNWEGVGVVPEVTTPPASTLARAHVLALEAVLPAETDPERRGLLELALKRTRAQVAELERGP